MSSCAWSGYLGAVGGQLVIDLVTVTAYDVDGTRIMVPQRVDPERVYPDPQRPQLEPKSSGVPTSPRADAFLAAIDAAPADQRVELKRLAGWAISLEQEGLVRLLTGHGKTIWNDHGAYVSLWRTVFERRAADEIPAVEAAIGTSIGGGNTVRSLSDDALRALSKAYRTAARAIGQRPWVATRRSARVA
ncbi:MAG: hypothetical protein ACLP0J_13775 [Solirubrobacteraceae bacterium]